MPQPYPKPVEMKFYQKTSFHWLKACHLFSQSYELSPHACFYFACISIRSYECPHFTWCEPCYESRSHSKDHLELPCIFSRLKTDILSPCHNVISHLFLLNVVQKKLIWQTFCYLFFYLLGYYMTYLAAIRRPVCTMLVFKIKPITKQQLLSLHYTDISGKRVQSQVLQAK